MRHPDLEKLVESDSTWPYEAYEFVLNSLDHAARTVQEAQDSLRDETKSEMESEIGSPGAEGGMHVDGRQIALAARAIAQEEFGQMAPVVFRQWGIQSTADLGRIIFKLIDIGLLNKNEKDSIEDFVGIYEIPEDLLAGFEIEIPDY